MTFLLETKNLSKSFPGVHALKNVNFQCQSGIVHGLVGENGAGKSTLIKVISGAHHVDQGEMIFRGEKVSFRSPRDAISKGVRVVYQEFTLIPYLTVAENICLGSLPTKFLSIDRKAMNQRACDYMGRLGLTLAPELLVKDLSIAEQQFVEIVKATSQETSLLILDEPTAALNSQQVDRLMALIKDVQKTGIGIIFVSHRLSEVLRICDEITVMKDGEIVDTYPTASLNQDLLVSRMVGRELRYTFPERSIDPSSEPFMQVKNMVSKSMRHPVSFSLNRNEILGVYGLEGQGQREFLRTLAGIEIAIDGQIILAEKPIPYKKVREAIRNGIAYTPADRKAEGLAISLPVQKNLGMPTLVCNGNQIVNFKKLTSVVNQQVKNLRIKVTSHQMSTVNLSGGNQQKIVIGKWLGVNPKVLILDEPTRGIDVESKMEIYSILRDLSNSGVGIMVLSSDLIELIGLCDRMIVFFEGRITGELKFEEFSEEKIMTYATATNSPGVEK
jgi:ABC-type sugar transport system ATPase subunit